MAIDVDAYLRRIGVDQRPANLSLETLAALQLAHLQTVPFENLHVSSGLGVRTDLEWSLDKVVNQRRGGWCFELNGAFGALLSELGFAVSLLGAAVLLAGPTTVIDHLTLEVMLDEPWLVDVGFGESFIRPLRLNDRGEQDGGAGSFQLMPSSQGLTLTKLVDGLPAPQYRFKRVNRALSDFDPASSLLQTDPELHWSQKPFATRLLGDGPERVTLLSDRLKFHGVDTVEEQPVAEADWAATLQEWFGMAPPS